MILTEYDEKKHLKNIRKEGFHMGEELFASLTQKLLQDSRYNDLRRAAEDKDYRNALYQEYGIEKK